MDDARALKQEAQPMTVELYRSPKDHAWRWRIRARNGRILADSAEGYERKGQAKRMARRLFPTFEIGEV